MLCLLHPALPVLSQGIRRETERLDGLIAVCDVLRSRS